MPPGKRADSSEKLIILRSNGAKHEIAIPLSYTLQDLKDAISQSKTLGNPAQGDQRIFHMGRELKSTGRTLEKLGICKWGIPIVHVHAKASSIAATTPPSVELEAENNPFESDSEDVVEVVNDHDTNKRNAATTSVATSLHEENIGGIIDLAESDEDDDAEIVVQPPDSSRCCKRQRLLEN